MPTFTGTPFNDFLIGGYRTEDTIYGLGGNDIIGGYSRNDVLYGGTGNDLIGGGSGDDSIFGEDGEDLMWGGSGSDYIDGGTGADLMYGGSSDDTLIGGDGDDTIFGGSGDDTALYTGATGGVVVDLDAGTATGGAGNDTLSDVENVTGSDFNDTLSGSSADNTVDGGAGADLLVLDGGGSDDARGGEGEDGFYFGAAFDQTDKVDGGAGTQDTLGLQGDYSAGVTFGAEGAVGIELVALLGGDITFFGAPGTEFYSYDLTLVDDNISAGEVLTFQANGLRVGENFILDASAETDGIILAYAGFGTEDLTGGQQGDGFFFGPGRFGAADKVDGQAGFDTLGLQGDFSAGFTMGADQMTSIELLSLYTGSAFGTSYGYDLTMDDNNVASGAALSVNGNQLKGAEYLYFDGSAELDGSFAIFSGAGNDSLTGSQNADAIAGGDGADTMTGGGGDDSFRYSQASQSTTAATDLITDFTSGDVIDLRGIDANETAAGNQVFAFIGSTAFSGTVRELRAVNVSGNNWVVEGDTNGDAVADFELDVTTSDGDLITAMDFLL